MEGANRYLYNAMFLDKGLREMGTTIAGVLVTTDTVVVFWVGDSRVYLHTRKGLTQITVDDWDDGYITQTLGGYPWFQPIRVHTTTIPRQGGRILAATDGLFGMTDRDTLAQTMSGPLETVPNRLLRVAIESGNTDDFSFALIDTIEPERQE